MSLSVGKAGTDEDTLPASSDGKGETDGTDPVPCETEGQAADGSGKAENLTGEHAENSNEWGCGDFLGCPEGISVATAPPGTMS